jgi:hypothetical protein
MKPYLLIIAVLFIIVLSVYQLFVFILNVLYRHMQLFSSDAIITSLDAVLIASK